MKTGSRYLALYTVCPNIGSLTRQLVGTIQRSVLQLHTISHVIQSVVIPCRALPYTHSIGGAGHMCCSSLHSSPSHSANYHQSYMCDCHFQSHSTRCSLSVKKSITVFTPAQILSLINCETKSSQPSTVDVYPLYLIHSSPGYMTLRGSR